MADAEIRSINALRAEQENDNTLLTPLECLKDAAEDLRTGKANYNKVLVISLNTDPATGDDAYDVHFYASNLRSSEMLALLATAQAKVLRNMNFLAAPRAEDE